MLPSFLTVGLWAFCVVAANRAARLVGGPAANLSRLSLAFVLLAIWAFTFGEGLRGESLRWFIFSGCIGFGLGDIAAFEAMPRIGPRLTSLSVTCLSAPMAAVIEWLWLGTRLAPAQMFWGAVILAGVAVALAPKEHVHLTRRQLVIGAVAGVLAAFGQGFGAVLSRKAYQIAGHSIDAGTATFQRALGGIVIVAAFLAFTAYRQREAPPRRDWRTGWKWIVAHALTGPTLGVACFQWALSSTPSGIVLPIVATTPLAVIPFAYFIEGDRPSQRSLIGGAIAVSGAVALALVK
jgi:drug/metabolite transporter (DMT)-like permease